MNDKLRVTLIKSTIGKPKKHCDIVAGLGLNRLNRTIELQDTPEVRGMIVKINHMVHIEQ